MADCRKTVDFLKERKRLCDSYKCKMCPVQQFFKIADVCPLFDDDLCDEKLIDYVQQWSDEHPAPKPKTYADDFFEKFPKASRKTGNIPFGCRGNVYGFDCKYYDHEQKFDPMYCVKCWNEPYKEGENG